jgi:hypothetical protein
MSYDRIWIQSTEHPRGLQTGEDPEEIARHIKEIVSLKAVRNLGFSQPRMKTTTRTR